MLRQYENQYHRRNLYLDFDLEDAAGPFLWEQYLAQPLNLK